MTKKLLTILLLLFALIPVIWAQSDKKIEKSEIIENINGRDYYLHFVEPGETLYKIAAAYGIRVDEIFKENPESQKGIRQGLVLKIPVKQSNVKNVQKSGKDHQGASFFYHIVQKQETYYGIAKKYNITVGELKALNPEISENLKEGQTLKVPVLHEPLKEATIYDENLVVHVVEKGETLYGIAQKYKVTLGQIYNLNSQLKQSINEGDEIYIPGQTLSDENIVIKDKETKKPAETHEVKAGETLYSIARTYGTSIDSIYLYNPQLSEQPHLNVGQELILPPNKTKTDYIVHNATRNQSLDKISELYQVEYEKIVKMNPRISGKAKKGQSVKIPVDNISEETLPELTEETEEIEETTPCEKSDRFYEKTFNVALMLPLFLEQVDSITPKERKDFASLESLKSMRFLNFYAGFEMALDSIKQKGMNVNLFVYDVDNSVEKTNKVLKASELSGMDLIIGPLFSKSFRLISDFANTYKIPLVNPLSEREEIIVNNPLVFKVKPSVEFQNEQLVNYLLKNYPDANIILVRNNKYKYQAEISFIRNSINKSRPGHINLSNKYIIDQIKKNHNNQKSLVTENKLFDLEDLKRSINDSSYISNMVKEINYVDDSARGLARNLSLLRPNIVVAISDDIVFTKDLLSKLNKMNLKHEITLFGIPDWMSFSDLETNHLINLNFHCFSNTIVDYDKPDIKNWIQIYRKRYHTEPASYNYAFDGFDVGWYFLNALYHFGPEFYNCTYPYNPGLIQNSFYFKQRPLNGFQNSHWNIGYYKNYRLVKAKEDFNIDENH